MAGISQNCKTGDVTAFGDCVGSASKALCGLTEAAGQVQNVYSHSTGATKRIILPFLLVVGMLVSAECFVFFFLPTGLLPGGCV